MHTLVTDQKHPATVFGNAQGVILHAGRTANVSQDNYLYSSPLLEVNRVAPIPSLDFDSIALLIHYLLQLVKEQLILRWQGQQDDGENA